MCAKVDGPTAMPETTSDNEITCHRCEQKFAEEENIVSVKDGFYHQNCFVCCQCFRSLPNKEFYEYEGRRYCKYDFQVLFAPFCSKCGEFIMSKVIKALNRSWHPQCLVCEQCGSQLISSGIQKFQKRVLCRPCFNQLAEQQAGRFLCHTCHQLIEPDKFIKYKGDYHHPHHFSCTECGDELGPDGRERGGDLYCLKCFGQTGIPICSACRRPVEGRIVWALGKAWHVDHFVCHDCEVPFYGSRFYEKQGHAYCLLHYQARMGKLCHICSRPVTNILAKFTNKCYCPEHFKCSTCDRQLDAKTKLYEIDLKPVCKDCYDRLPTHWKRTLAKIHLNDPYTWQD